MTTIFAFHHAGGSAAALMTLRDKLVPSADVQLIELPGRGMRRHEPLHTQRRGLIEQLHCELAPRINQPYALFGHSLGAVIAYELAHSLIANGQRAPRMLFVAAASAPRLRPEAFASDAHTDAELIAELRTLGGTPEEFFASPQLLELVLPIVRADLRLCDDASPILPPLPCPIHAFAGREDRVTRAQLEAWQEHTARRLSLSWFDGDHFFTKSHAEPLARAMIDRLVERPRLLAHP